MTHYVMLDDFVEDVPTLEGWGWRRWRQGHYVFALDLLRWLACAADRRLVLPDVVILDDVVPFEKEGNERPSAAWLAAAVRRLYGGQPVRVVALSGSHHTANDLLAMLELGCDDVVKKRRDPPWRDALRKAAEPTTPRAHFALQPDVKDLDAWPPRDGALGSLRSDARERVFRDWLPLVPLWEDGILLGARVEEHLAPGLTERSLLGRHPDVAGTLTGDSRLQRAEIVKAFVREGVSWVPEATRREVRDIPWSRVTRARVSNEQPRFASVSDPDLRRRLYPCELDPRSEHGGDWIYREGRGHFTES